MDVIFVEMLKGWWTSSGWNETDIRSEFLRMDELDLVMESVWMIGNHVAATCHMTFGIGPNFLMDFYMMFQDLYLTPLVKHW